MSNSFPATHLGTNVRNVVDAAESLPDGVTVFLFGSACYRDCPNDIDMLFVYEAASLPPQSAYSALQPLMAEIENAVGVPVRSVVLTEEEARESGFVSEVEAIELRSTRGVVGA